MPLDYDAAPAALACGGSNASADRAAVVAAVERFLVSKGIALPPAAAAPARAQVTEATIASITAEVVDRFLAKRGSGAQGGGQGSPGNSGNPGGYG